VKDKEREFILDPSGCLLLPCDSTSPSLSNK
jgi:hypothetical protein